MNRSDNASRFGFRIVGSCHNERRLVEWQAAFVGYAQCDERAEVNREAYLSAFCFSTEFRIHLDTLQRLSVSRLCELATEPRPFELPEPPNQCNQAADDWLTAVEAVEKAKQVAIERRNNGTHRTSLNRATLDFIRDGATNGHRHRLLFSAAANLAGFGCRFELAYALLSESALDSGLSPSEVRRQIECGLNHSANRYHPTGLVMKPPAPSGMEAGN